MEPNEQGAGEVGSRLRDAQPNNQSMLIGESCGSEWNACYSQAAVELLNRKTRARDREMGGLLSGLDHLLPSQEQSSVSTRWLSAACNSKSGGLMLSFGLCGHLYACGGHNTSF